MAAAMVLAVGVPATLAQTSTETVADSFCALFTPEEVEAVLGAPVTARPETVGCQWSTADGGLMMASAGWYDNSIADHQQLFPAGTDHTIGGRTAWFSPGMFLQELLIELDPSVLRLVITGFDGDVEAALLELGELAVARAGTLVAPGPDPTVPSMSADPELEALFPDSIGGAPLEVISVAGAHVFSDPEDQAAVVEFLGTLGKTLDDVSVAFAALPNGAIQAVRVAGADSTAFMEPLVQAIQGAEVETVPAQVAGKDVIHVPAIPGYVYPSGDVVWVIQSEEPVLSEVLAALP
jgi:hypothetical protein